jgi:hypothetical protein
MSQPTTNLGPHRPISNLAGLPVVPEPLLSPPTLGQVGMAAGRQAGMRMSSRCSAT